MKKQSITLGLLALCSAVFAQSKTVVIKGTFTGDTKGNNKVYIYGNGVKNDSAVITDGVFTFNLPFEKTFMPLFYTEYDKNVKRMYQPFALLIDQPGTVILSGADIAKGMNTFEVSGMETPASYALFRKKQNEVYAAANKKIGEKYGPDWYKNTEKREEINKEQSEAVKAGMGKMVKEFIQSHPDSYASANALTGVKSTLDPAEVEQLYKLLSPRMRQTEEAKSVSGYLAGLKKSAIGSTIADFTLNNATDKPLAFASLKGKYVLIDFWASWCGPCKQSFPHMKEVYAKYKSDKFEIYSISIDKDKDAWLKGIKDNDLPWLQTLDTKGISNSSFAVTGVPTTFLVDPQGKILLKEVGFEPGGNSPLEKKLDELFGKN